MTAQSHSGLALLAGTLLFSIAGQAMGEDDPELRPFTKPGSTVEAGAGYLSGTGRHFGEYTGVNERGVYGLLGIDLVNRDDATGTWFTLNGRNLGFENRELRIEHNRQASWGYYIDLGRTPHFDPYVINSRLSGIGTGSETINGLATAQDNELRTRRDTIKLGADKTLFPGFDVQFDFRNEEKTGTQPFGQGFFGPINFLVNPINYTTRQLDAILNYTSERLQLSGGYYGTAFFNHAPALEVAGGIAGLSPVALPPGNESHQLNVTGGYNFTPTTRGAFTAAYTHQTQSATFVAPSVSGRTDLGGVVDTTLLQAGVTSQPLPKLSVLANIRYLDKDDRTPVVLYTTIGITGASTLDGFNTPSSLRATTGKLEATYQLPAAFRLTGGVDYDRRDRNTYRVHSVSFRDQTEETTLRAELRRTMFDTLTGALSYAHSDRGGSNYQLNVLNDNTPGSNQVGPLNVADRERNKVRLTLNWQPLGALSIGFYTDYAQDEYSGRVLGPREGKAGTYSVDAAYSVSDKWQLSAWLSRNDVKADTSTCALASPVGVCANTVASPLWSSSLRNTGDALGAALRGKPYAWLEVGADATASRDTSEYNLATTTPGAAVSSLPDTYFKVTRLNLFARYALRKDSDLKFNYTFERWSTDDWTWTTWTYTDGTRVMHEPTQRVHFIGVTFTQRWQ